MLAACEDTTAWIILRSAESRLMRAKSKRCWTHIAKSQRYGRWSGPLHSTRIRGRRKHFSWLALDAAREAAFLNHLENTILTLPVIGNACVVDRPGYIARYAELYAPPWTLCKTAYAILIERSAKFARSQGKRLKIFYEEAGEKEDRDLEAYTKLLKTEGMPFNRDNAKAYDGLTPHDFQDILSGEPHRITKEVPMVQFSDLILYPIAKGGYDRTYRSICEANGSKKAYRLPPGCRSEIDVRY